MMTVRAFGNRSLSIDYSKALRIIEINNRQGVRSTIKNGRSQNAPQTSHKRPLVKVYVSHNRFREMLYFLYLAPGSPCT